jgi:hypothetical protein
MESDKDFIKRMNEAIKKARPTLSEKTKDALNVEGESE